MERLRDQAEEQMLDSALMELTRGGASRELAGRIADRLVGTRVRRSGRRWLAAALVAAGLGVVAWIASMDRQDGSAGVAAGASDQDPKPTPKSVVAEIERLAANLKDPDLRDAARAALQAFGPKARPVLIRVLGESVAANADAAYVAELRELLGLLSPFGQSKVKFGLNVAEPVTLVADYSDNRIVMLDARGKEIWWLEEIFGAWDAELTKRGTLLITEFSVSRVREVDSKGKTLWTYEDLKNPYDADLLDNGNVLIANTFGSKVVEVDPQGKVVWEYKDLRPFDVERLADGNTLIADVLRDRIIEVDPQGKIVWKVENQPNVHDVDRLANGNTLATLRTLNCVREIDASGKIVFEIKDLASPSDADRLPDGTTIVAENGRVRQFDRNGKQVWSKEMTWAVEINRY